MAVYHTACSSLGFFWAEPKALSCLCRTDFKSIILVSYLINNESTTNYRGRDPIWIRAHSMPWQRSLDHYWWSVHQWCSNGMGVSHLTSREQAGHHLTINTRFIDEAGGSMLGCRWRTLESSPYWWCFQMLMMHITMHLQAAWGSRALATVWLTWEDTLNKSNRV